MVESGWNRIFGSTKKKSQELHLNIYNVYQYLTVIQT